MEKIKIAYILHQFPVLSETFVADEILALKKIGAEVSVFSFAKPPHDVMHKESLDLAKGVFYALDPKSSTGVLTAVLLSNLQFFLSSPFRYCITFFKYFFKIGKKEFLQIFYICRLIKKEKPEHLHAHFAGLGATAAMIVSGFLKVPFSFTAHAHDIFVEDDFLEDKLRKAKYVVAISEYNKEYLFKKYPRIPASKIKVIHCGVDVDLFRPETAASSETTVLLSGGRFVEKKGFTYLIKSCKLLIEKGIRFRCDIFGDGPLKEELLGEARELGLEDMIRFVGPVDRNTVLKLLSGSDIFISPCIVAHDGDRDGIPVTIMEAMSAGKAVVSTDISGMPELINTGENGILVPQKDTNKLSQAISKLIEDRSLRRQIGIRARDKIEKEFNLTKNAGALFDLFSEADGRGGQFNILYINGTAQIGGAEVSLINLIKRVDRKHFLPIVLVPGDGPLVKKVKDIKIDVLFSKTPEFSKRKPFSFVKAVLVLTGIIRKNKISLVHSNSIYVSELSYYAAALAGVPCVCHIRDLVPILGGSKTRMRAFRRMAKLIAISEAVKKDLTEKLNIPEDGIVRIYNGVDIDEFSPGVSGEDFKKEFKLHSEKLIGIIGRISMEKGHEFFLRTASEVVKDHKNVAFVVVGSEVLGSGEFKDATVKLSEELGLQNKIIFTGFRDDIPQIIAALDIVVVPSVAEPFGRVIIEAMAMEKPVIATSSGASTEIVSGDCGILVEPGNVEQLKEAIIALLKDQVLANKIGKRGREIVSKRFTIDRHVAAMENLYEGFLEKLNRAEGKK
ncbi:MAG: hypothetical protein COS99_01995 [Candidatus Omnitrophica bacterium CG07_land_8_20_14_0_80_42_15]|uniref:Glycosyltransferase family 1 protein n=1 Tax=Candidatus Aquitaenariimonas noxiae TaxID=1974741 RepID=A0A2J0KU95_9BACT|nr:MAG: hypothetical protein COS99_01995 [Candidatus Omnitrophica bacterium CG07_land_8_20_14_0_80_42_15]